MPSLFSCVQLFATPWAVACQAPLSMGFSRQEYWSGFLHDPIWTAAHQAPLSMGFSREEYWSGLPCPPLGGSSQPRDQNRVPCIADRFFTNWATREAYFKCSTLLKLTSIVSFLNMAPRKFEMTCMAHIIFLSDSTVPEDQAQAKDGTLPIQDRG